MAFCNGKCACGDFCGRQDDHGGECDCRDDRCRTHVCGQPQDTRPGMKPKKPKPQRVKRAPQYCTTETSFFMRGGTRPRKKIVVVPPRGTGWTMCGAVATATTLRWFWVR